MLYYSYFFFLTKFRAILSFMGLSLNLFILLSRMMMMTMIITGTLKRHTVVEGGVGFRSMSSRA